MNEKSRVGSALAEGLVAGLIGYAAVVVTVSALDLIQGSGILHTPREIGTALFFGGADGTTPTDTMAPVLAWNGVHLLASLLAGLIGAVMVLGAERFLGFWWAGLMVLVTVGVYALIGLGGLGVQVAGVLDWPTALLGTAVWLGAMTAYFAWAHRRLRGQLEMEMGSDD